MGVGVGAGGGEPGRAWVHLLNYGGDGGLLEAAMTGAEEG